MRASDQDRERTVQVLRGAYVVGRLDLEEFRDRAGTAYRAKTWGELDDLTADLPAGPGWTRAARRRLEEYYEVIEWRPGHR